VNEAVVVIVCAAVWWIPTFMGLSDLQRRERLPRPTVWRWTVLMAVPVIGPLVYYRRGRPALDAGQRTAP
jgi:hypothetical protein